MIKVSILNKLFENAKPKFSFEAPAKNNEWLDVSIVGIISKEIKKSQ